MKKILGVGATMLFLCAFAWSYPGGVPGATKKTGPSGCGSCHGSSPSTSVIATLSGPSTLNPGQKAQYVLTVSGGPGTGSGCTIAASTGTLEAVSTYLKVAAGELVQNSSVGFTSGSIQFIFNYTAPVTPGTITLYATGYSSSRSQATGVWNFSPDFLVTVAAPTSPPAAPVPVSPANGALDQLRSSMTFKWNSSPTTAQYFLQLATDLRFTSLLVNDSTLADTSYKKTNLLSATIHYWRVAAINAAGVSDWSSVWNFTTIDSSLQPAVPTNLTVTPGNEQATLRWNTNTEPNVAKYFIYFGQTANPIVKADSATGGNTDTVKVIPNLTVGRTYYFRVTAANTAGYESDFSNEVSAAIPMGALSGNYYIGARLGSRPGGGDPDFASLTDWWGKLKDTINTSLVGPTTFYLLDSVYTLSAQLRRLYVRGGGPSNPVRLKPYAGVRPKITWTTAGGSGNSGQWEMGDEAYPRHFHISYWTFDGSNTEGGTTRDLTFNFNGGNGFRFFGDANHVTIKNCNINNSYTSVQTGTTPFATIMFSLNIKNIAGPLYGYHMPDSNIVENNVITHYGAGSSMRAIAFWYQNLQLDPTVTGVSGTIIRNNIIAAPLHGIYLWQVKDAEIYGNTIRVVPGVNAPPNVDAAGICYYLGAYTAAGTVNIYNNTIDTLRTTNVAANGKGVNGIMIGPRVTGTVNVYNNMITGFQTEPTSNGFARGISVDSLPTVASTGAPSVNVYHNSIHIPPISITDSVAGFFWRPNPVANANVNLKNNIIVVQESDDTSYCIAKAIGTSGMLVSDWNVLYAGGSAKVGRWDTLEAVDIAAWQTTSSQDANSKSANPAATFGGSGQWKNAFDLHFAAKPDDAFGAPQVGGITKDIDGEPRGTKPYVGADELPASPMAAGDEASRPLTFELSQNYPNPFNPTTRISFALPGEGHVELIVIDLLGRRVATLVNEERSAGRHTVEWNANEVSTGVYFYTIRTRESTSTRKMLLLR